MDETPPVRPEAGMVVGLFWVAADGVHLGAPATTPAPTLVLQPSGPRLTGPDPRTWTWSEIADLQVTEVPVRSALNRWASRAASVAAAAMDVWVPGDPERMTVSVTTPDGCFRTSVHSGAAVAYSPREVDLSRQLIDRFVRGGATPALMTQWWEKSRPTGILRSREREEVLELWLAQA
ncbi:hypothetical protein [Streptomyces sp. NPDC054794]